MGSNGNGNPQGLRFGVFDVDLRTQELRKHGTRVKLPRQSFQILQMLLERPGELVTREELQKALWPADTFVDFDHGLNNAVKRIRAALGDKAETPRWIETLPRLGYRFIGAVDIASNGHVAPPSNGTPSAPRTPAPPAESAFASLRRSWLIPAVAVLVVCLAGWQYYRVRRARAASDSLQISPFTSYPGFEYAPTFSPDGNQIAFAWTGGDQTEAGDLYVKVVGTETPVQLTHNPGSPVVPAWSPDGRFIAFARYKPGSPESSGIFLIPAVGGPERKLAQLGHGKTTYEGGIGWTRDSTWIIYPEPTDSEFHSRLAAVNIESLEHRTFPNPSPRCSAVGLPQISPDGKSLAYSCMFSFGLGGLFVQPWPTGNVRQLVEAKGDFEGLSWDADGQSILYSLNTNLWRISTHGGKPQRLWFGQSTYGLAIAREGARLAFTHMEEAVDVWRVPTSESVSASMPAQRVAPSELSQQNAQYSPDGKRIAFESKRGGSDEVWVCQADGSDLRKLTSFGGPLTGTPRWSPDGHRIVLDSRASGKPELYVVNSDGGTPVLLPTTPEGGSVPYWSHDGKWIYFASDVQGFSQIFKIPAEGGNPIQLTRQGGFIAKETPDGSRVYYLQVRTAAEFWSMAPDGTGEARVEGLPDFAWPAWDLTQNGIYFYDAMPADPEIQFFDFATRRTRRAIRVPSRLAPFVTNLSVSPDGKDLLYTQLGRSSASIMLVDGFR